MASSVHRMDPRHWRLWSLPRPLLAYVLTVTVAAVLVISLSVFAYSVDAQSWIWFGLLAAGTVVHLEAAQGIERLREVAAEGKPYAHLQDVWLFAGVLLLPLPLQLALVGISFVHEWFRVYRGRALAYRKVFSASTVALSCAAATVVLAVSHQDQPHQYVAVLNGPLGLAVLAVAGAVYWIINYALVVGAIIMANPSQPPRRALGDLSDQLIIVAGIGLGSAVAVLTVNRPWFVPVLLVTVLALHMGLLLPQFRAAATDSKTGLCDPTFWNTTAERELDRARRLSSTAGVLMLDLDHFKLVNDTYGHLAVDAVLRAVADAIRHTVRSRDLVGRWGGEEFAVLMPGLTLGQIEAAAERVRVAVSHLEVVTRDHNNDEVTISGLAVSIGAGVYPDTATRLSPLLLAVDHALFQAKQAGRNRTVVAA